MVLRRDPVRAAGRRTAFRRRQPTPTPGEGEERCLSHPTLRTPRLPEPPEGDDRGEPGEEADGKEATSSDSQQKRC